VKLAQIDKGEKVALKISRKYENDESSSNTSLFYKEVNALSKLKHPNIIKMHDYSDDSLVNRPNGSTIEVIYISLEYIPNGEIFDYIAESGRFSEDESRYYFRQLISALDYMHSQGYAHRDVKPENILMDSDFNMKLADFGFATRDKKSKSRKGTFGYMAPEVLAHHHYDCKQHDLYGAAVILFIMTTQHPPFIRAEPSDKYFKKIYDGNWNKFWEVHDEEKLSASFIDLMTKMLAFNPHERLTMKQIKEHEWFNGPVPSSEDIKAAFEDRLSLMKKQKHHHAKSTNSKVAPPERRLTKFFDVSDGDDLLNILLKFAEINGIAYDKSKEFFRAELQVEEIGQETSILASVLKKPNSDQR
jgi:serine/threonine protein kinase